jgi:hypothetical protein
MNKAEINNYDPQRADNLKIVKWRMNQIVKTFVDLSNNARLG